MRIAWLTGVAAVSMVLGLLAGVPSASADPPSAGGGGCPDVEVVFARGTTEAPGVGGIGQAFVDSLQSQIGQKSLWTHAVDYPADMGLCFVIPEGAGLCQQVSDLRFCWLSACMRAAPG